MANGLEKETEIQKQFREKDKAYKEAFVFVESMKMKYNVSDDISRMLTGVGINKVNVNNMAAAALKAKTEQEQNIYWYASKQKMVSFTITEKRKEEVTKFFEKMPDEVVKSKGFKNFCNVFMESLVSKEQKRVDEFKAKEQNLKKKVNTLIKYAEREFNIKQLNAKNIMEAIKTEEIQLEIAQHPKWGGYTQAGINKQMQRLNNAKNLLRSYEEVKKEKDQLENTINDKVNAVCDKAQLFSELLSTRAKGHSNSKEYTNMLLALRTVQYWNEPFMQGELNAKRNQGEPVPGSLQEALENLQQKANTYLEEKEKQFRPFPSALRENRKALVESLIKSVESDLNDMKILPREKAVESRQVMKQVAPQKDTSRLIYG